MRDWRSETQRWGGGGGSAVEAERSGEGDEEKARREGRADMEVVVLGARPRRSLKRGRGAIVGEAKGSRCRQLGRLKWSIASGLATSKSSRGLRVVQVGFGSRREAGLGKLPPKFAWC